MAVQGKWICLVFCHFYKGGNFYDFLFVFLYSKSLLKRRKLQKERICSPCEQNKRSRFFLFREDPFSEEDQKCEQILSFWSRPLSESGGQNNFNSYLPQGCTPENTPSRKEAKNNFDSYLPMKVYLLSICVASIYRMY